ncbi:DivIVA domain-containing protein [Gordonia iterans]
MSSDHARLTADDVHHVAFSKPPVLQRGYHEDQVDAFLDALEAKFRDPADPTLAHLTPDQVRQVSFSAPPMGQRGYHPGEVDDFLGQCADDLADLVAEVPVDQERQASAGANASAGLTAADIRDATFGKPLFGRSGYNEDQVDDFLDALEAKFRDPADPALSWLTPGAVQEAVFGPPGFGRRGYRRDEVDDFLARAAAALSLL